MSIEIRVPDLPESVNDATIAAWVVKEGETVEAEQNLVELETDKVVLEVPAPTSGKLKKILAETGKTVYAGDVIAVLEEGEKGGTSVSESAQTESDVDDNQDDEAQEKTLLASPSVRKLLVEHGLDENRITGTGKHGRILKEDVERHLNSMPATGSSSSPDAKSGTRPVEIMNQPEERSTASTPAPTQPKSTTAMHTATSKETTSSSNRPIRRVPMTRLRARIAERLLEAQHNAAILSTFNEVDLSEVARLRRKYQERFQKVHGIKLGFMSFFVKAATEALKRYPEINARIEGGDIIYQGFYDIGVAVSTDRGLVVPILRDTDAMGNAEIEKAIADYAERARNGQLELDELTGGTFSITNGGVFGSMLSTPILNPPQSAILGMHKIQERPVVVNGEIVIRPMMYLALSYDHRLIDGKAAVSFLVKVKELLEDPASLFLEL